MATGSLVSIHEYLNTSYRPDCDYVDGAVLERNVGEYDHGRLPGAVSCYYFIRRKDGESTRCWRSAYKFPQRVFECPMFA